MLRSLRSRVALTAVLSVAVTSLIVLFSIAFAAGPVARHSQQQELQTILDRAIALDGKVSTARLADRLTEPGFSVVVTLDGQDYPASSNVAIITNVDKDENYLTETETLPKSGISVTVATLSVSTFDMYSQILTIGVPTILLALLVLVLALGRVTRLALRPLDDMTALATQIADGELGRRLEVEDPGTELGRTAVAFDKMLDALESSIHRARTAEERLRQLCADVAHELRSPVSSMVAAADNLMRELSLGNRGSAATKELAEETAMAVVRDGRRAGRIVGDLTLAAQLDVQELAGREVVKQRVDLTQLAKQAVESFSIGSDYSVCFEDDAGPSWSMADPERIQQVITNLLSNANRWTETSVDIKVQKTQQTWQLTVTDDGPGVPAAERENIFGRFVRLDSDRARSKGGSGLGLSISKALAEAHGGTLECLANATASGGAVFRLTVKLEQ